MNAHDKFKKGDRVRLIKENQFAFSRKSILGTVVGFSYDARFVRVKPDAIVKIHAYHPDFWEVEQREEK